MGLLLNLLAVHVFWSLDVSCKGFDIDGNDESKVGWVWDDGSRTTFDIIWGCVAVIIVCTYKVIHLNLPAKKEADAAWSELLFWKKWLRKFKWMFFMAVSPELLFSMALLDWLWARDSVRKFAQVNLKYHSSMLSHAKSTAEIIASNQEGRFLSILRRTPHHVPLRAWTQEHAHYANMGGYIITFPKQDTSEQYGVTAQMLVAPTAEALRPAAEYNHPSFPLSAAQLLVLVEEFMYEIPYITQNDIKDRSKADAFTKLFAIGQSSWLIVQCIARAAQGLPFTELELATMGFVGYAVALYLLWWHKPFDVEHSVSIECPPQDQEQVIERLRGMFETRYKSKYLSPRWDDFLREERIRNWAYMHDLELGRKTWLASTLSIIGIGMLFSGLHLAAWNWAFPSMVETWLWRSSALFATAACIPVAILLPFMGIGQERWQRYIVRFFFYPLAALYLMSRATLMCQTFLCFRAMPDGVYLAVQWTLFLPRLS